MRIDTIETFVAGHWLFVAVTTDAGVTGIGESTYFTHPLAARSRTTRADLIGIDAIDGSTSTVS